MPPIKYSSVHLIPLLCSAVVNRDGQEHPPASTPNLFPLATDTKIPWDGCGSSKQNVLGAGGVSLAGGVPPDLTAFCRTLGMLRGKGPSQGMLLSWSSTCHPQSIPGHPHFVAPRWWPQEGTGVTLGVWVTDHPWGNLNVRQKMELTLLNPTSQLSQISSTVTSHVLLHTLQLSQGKE